MTTRIGLVGTGDIGRLHAQALTAIPGVELVIAQGRNPARAEKLAVELGARTAESFSALLKDESIDAVDVCVPNDLHASYVVAAAKAGRHVLCEKPIALTLADAAAMVEAAETAGVRLMVGHSLRFWPEYVQGREVIKSGILGPIRTFTARRMVSLLLAVQGEAGWRHSAERSGGAVLDLQVHDIDFILWTFGMPRYVTSRGVKSEVGAYDHVFTLLDYENGLRVSIESSFMLKGNPVIMDFRAIGDDASLEFSFVESEFAMHDIHSEGDKVQQDPALVLYRWGKPREVLAEQTTDPVTTMLNEETKCFVSLVRGETVEAPLAMEAKDALAVALASLQSIETGKTVDLGGA